MPGLEFCVECDKPSKVLDWRYLCEQCAEQEDERNYDKED
mgnify:CR=1 FL=1